jgi:hypothetical protein
VIFPKKDWFRFPRFRGWWETLEYRTRFPSLCCFLPSRWCKEGRGVDDGATPHYPRSEHLFHRSQDFPFREALPLLPAFVVVYGLCGWAQGAPRDRHRRGLLCGSRLYWGSSSCTGHVVISQLLVSDRFPLLVTPGSWLWIWGHTHTTFPVVWTILIGHETYVFSVFFRNSRPIPMKHQWLLYCTLTSELMLHLNVCSLGWVIESNTFRCVFCFLNIRWRGQMVLFRMLEHGRNLVEWCTRKQVRFWNRILPTMHTGVHVYMNEDPPLIRPLYIRTIPMIPDESMEVRRTREQSTHWTAACLQ